MKFIWYRGEKVVAGTNALMRECLKKQQKVNWFVRLMEILANEKVRSLSQTKEVQASPFSSRRGEASSSM